ncbi:MAG: deoxyguanosinetriphosphate triphosphohydrolase, partial [Chloroflexi bacterium]|nr:deoxyguanosinetriphosphate triphosphohydrolase [Chloroflexota bacterium]
IAMSERVAAATNELRDFMFANVYEWEERLADAERARRIVEFLFEHYLAHPEALTSDFTRPDDPLVRRVADYIAGMTDRFAQSTADALGMRS